MEQIVGRDETIVERDESIAKPGESYVEHICPPPNDGQKLTTPLNFVLEKIYVLYFNLFLVSF